MSDIKYNMPGPFVSSDYEFPYIWVIVGGILSFAVSFGMGANNVSNAIGTSVGSGAISRRTGLILAAIFEFLGTCLLGGKVTDTLKTAIISPVHFYGHQELFAYGMIATMIASVIWLFFATHYGLPISATQTIIGGIIGFAIIEHRMDVLELREISFIVGSWFLSPIIGTLISSSLYYSIYKLVLEKGELNRIIIPIYYSATFTLLLGMIVSSRGAPHLPLNIPFEIIPVISFFIILFVVWWKRPYLKPNLFSSETNDAEHGVPPSKKERTRESLPSKDNPNEQPFKFLMVTSAAFMAFAHGSNDVSNAAAPFVPVIEMYRVGYIHCKSSVPLVVLVGCGIGIVLGLFILGYKTLETVGEKITKITFSKGYAAQISAAGTIVVASFWSIPISTTAILIGSIVGVGFIGENGSLNFNAVDKQVLFNIVSGWFWTLIVGVLGTPVFYLVIRLIVD